MTLLTFVRDGDTGMPQVALIADDDQGHLVSNPRLPNGVTQADLDSSVSDENRPTAAAEWINFMVALFANYTNSVDPVANVPEMKDAHRIADETFAEDGGDDQEQPQDLLNGDDDPNINARVAFDSLAQDYPDTVDAMYDETDEETFDPQAMLNYVTMSLGPIDPEGPNGWLLRAADGEPVPEGSYVHFGQPGDEEESNDNAPAGS